MNVRIADRSQGDSATAFAQILDGAAAPLIVKDHASRYAFVNDAACALIGRSQDELRSRTDRDIWPKEEAERIRAMDEAVLSTGKEREWEAQLVAAGGKRHTLRVTERRVVLEGARGSQEKFVIASLADVSELRRTQQVLQANEEHYRAVIDLHPQIPWTADPNGNILEAGPRWAELTGMPEEDALGAGWLKALHPDDLPTVREGWQHALCTGEPLDIEYRVRMTTGYCRWFRARAAARRDRAGKIVRWYGILEDVDDRRRAIDALRESEARFRALADDAPVMIWAADETGNTSFFSRAWLQTTGQTEEEALGFGWIEVVHPDDRDAVQDAFFSANTSRKPVRAEYRLRRADGSWAWVLDVGQPRFSGDGTFLG